MESKAVMIYRVFVAAAVFLITSSPALCQAHAEFDVASVKPVDNSTLGDSISMNIGTVRHEEVTFGNATLNDCIRFAYGMASDAQISAPDWIKSKRFLYDIVAKGKPGSSPAELQAMMQTLLADRFKLVTHRDQKEMSYFALVAAKKGLKIHQMTEVPDGFRGITNGGHIDRIMAMPGLAYLLSRFETERPIIDETGLDGLYEVKLDWTLRQLQNADVDAPGPSLFTALEDQAGLRLEARKGQVGVLVVDSAEKVPTAN